MNLFSKLRHLVRKIWNNLFSIFQSTLILLLVALAVVFVVIMFSKNPEWIFNLLGIAKNGELKYEALKFLGIGMGGVLVALQALMSSRRAKAMEHTAQAQADAAQAQADAVSKTEQGQRQDRLKNAIEHLGHEKDSVRLGGAYELVHLAEDTEGLRQTVLDILCAHIRQTTGESKYREKHTSKPSEEVQSLLTLPFVQKREVFKDLHINLEGSWLNGANLEEALLAKAVLTRTHLRGANLVRAHLQEANLHEAQLQEALLAWAELQRAFLDSVQLQGAALDGAQLQGAKLDKACLQGARLTGAQLQGARLTGAYLQGARLTGAQLQGAALFDAQLQGAALFDAQLQGIISDEWLSSVSFEDCIKKQVGKETDFRLSKVIFSGGLSQEDVESLVKDLSDEKANELREKLTPHIGKPPSNQRPENSDAITAPYTAEDAEKWIAEYKEAIS